MLEKQVSNVGEVVNAMAALKLGEEEQTRLERTLGRALLAKMRGDNVDLQEIYRNLGGSDPVVEIVLDSRVNGAFARMPVGPGVEAVRVNASRPEILRTMSAKKSVSVDAANALGRVEGQAINTLFSLRQAPGESPAGATVLDEIRKIAQRLDKAGIP